MVNKQAIRNLMVLHGIKLNDISELLGLSRSSVHKKLNGFSPMYLHEAEKIQKLLTIHDEDFAFYFLGNPRV